MTDDLYITDEAHGAAWSLVLGDTPLAPAELTESEMEGQDPLFEMESAS